MAWIVRQLHRKPARVVAEMLGTGGRLPDGLALRHLFTALMDMHCLDVVDAPRAGIMERNDPCADDTRTCARTAEWRMPACLRSQARP